MSGMHKSCHRCGGDLPSGDGLSPFCPHCGAPQLFLTEDYITDQQLRSEDPDAPGAQPPPLPRQVDWQAAIRSAAIVAAIAAILCVVSLKVPGVSLISTIWILTGSTTALALYRRQRPLAWMDASIGARVGLTTGLCVVVLVAVTMAIAGLVARFGLHAMTSFDADFAQMLAQAKLAGKQAAASSSPEATAEVVRLYDLPEFQAGLILTSISISSICLLLFSAFGGAVNGLLRSRSRARL